jgi:dihydroorotase-like cyclic amidohydrolase
MNTESLRNDPTAKELIHILFPDEIAEAEAKGIEKGIEKGIKIATEELIHRLSLSEEQIQKFQKDGPIIPPTQ